MNGDENSELPESWLVAPLQEIADINPKLDKSAYADDIEVSFVPMPAVEAETGVIVVNEARQFGAVKKGYTAFREGDVLFAKITPCMENGKMAVVPAVKNGLGFGSTEFHVLRPYEGISAEYIYYFVSCQRFRYDAEHNMTGAVGQRRVPAPYLSKQLVPVATEKAQKRIVAKIDELFSELDKGVESLKTAREQLKVYRQAVLKHAFEGKITAQWREENKNNLETADQLIARIKQEREARYEQQFDEWKAAVKAWEAERKPGKKPSKPKKPSDLELMMADDLPVLPEGWIWVRYGDLCSLIRNGISRKPEGNTGAKIFRISAVRPMEFDLDDVRYIDNTAGDFDDYYLKCGDLLFTRYNGSRAYVGVCAEYKSDGSHLYPDKLIRTQLAAAATLSGYIEKAVNCGPSRNFIEGRIRTTAGQSGISGSDIRGIPVPLCSPSEQAVIQDRVDEELSNISQLLSGIEEDLRRSEALRQSILKKAFSGQLVEQDRNDEPASVLLEQIKAENAVEENSNKKSKKRKAAA